MKKLLLSQILLFVSILTFGQKTAISVTASFTGAIAANATNGCDDGTGFGWYSDTDADPRVVVSQNNEQIITLTAADQYQGWGAYTYNAGNGINKVNIASKPKLQFKMKSDVDISFQVALQTGTNQSTNYLTIILVGGAAYETFTLDYTNDANTADFTLIQGPRFQISDAGPITANVRMDDLKMGDAVVAGVKSSSMLISDSKLFPNPSTNATSLEYSLLEASKVKVVLTDMMGKQLDVLVDEVASAGVNSKSFDVSGYSKGLYFVNYFINGNPVSMQTLMVE